MRHRTIGQSRAVQSAKEGLKKLKLDEKIYISLIIIPSLF